MGNLGEEPLISCQHFDPVADSLVYLFLLRAQIQAFQEESREKVPAALLPPGSLWSRMVSYLRAFNPVQVRYAGQEWRQLVELVAQAAQMVSKVGCFSPSTLFYCQESDLYSPSWPYDWSGMPCCDWTLRVLFSLQPTYFLSASACVQGHIPMRCQYWTGTCATSLHRYPALRLGPRCCSAQPTTPACLLSLRPLGFRQS